MPPQAAASPFGTGVVRAIHASEPQGREFVCAAHVSLDRAGMAVTVEIYLVSLHER